MFFSAYLGTDAGLPLWRGALTKHASWLGLLPRVESRRLGDSSNLALAWLGRGPLPGGPPLYETAEYILAPAPAPAPAEGVVEPTPGALQKLLRQVRSNAIRVGASVASGEVTVVVPLATPAQLYYTRTAQGYFLADDLRFFARLPGGGLDERA